MLIYLKWFIVDLLKVCNFADSTFCWKMSKNIQLFLFRLVIDLFSLSAIWLFVALPKWVHAYCKNMATRRRWRRVFHQTALQVVYFYYFANLFLRTNRFILTWNFHFLYLKLFVFDFNAFILMKKMRTTNIDIFCCFIFRGLFLEF